MQNCFKTTLIATIGLEEYREACRSARGDAERSDYGRGDPGQHDTALVPHELSDALWESDEPVQTKIRVFFELYDELPSYGLLMYVSHHYPDWPPDARRQFWNGVRERLGGSDQALARPLAYGLWCDWFEHGDHVDEAWEALTSDDVPPRALQQVLIASGPVPWALKRSLYARLLEDPKWHYYIFRSLLHSAFDVFGQYDRDEAAQLLSALELPADTEHLADLRTRLTGTG